MILNFWDTDCLFFITVLQFIFFYYYLWLTQTFWSEIPTIFSTEIFMCYLKKIQEENKNSNRIILFGGFKYSYDICTVYRHDISPAGKTFPPETYWIFHDHIAGSIFHTRLQILVIRFIKYYITSFRRMIIKKIYEKLHTSRL